MAIEKLEYLKGFIENCFKVSGIEYYFSTYEDKISFKIMNKGRYDVIKTFKYKNENEKNYEIFIVKSQEKKDVIIYISDENNFAIKIMYINELDRFIFDIDPFAMEIENSLYEKIKQDKLTKIIKKTIDLVDELNNKKLSRLLTGKNSYVQFPQLRELIKQ